MSRAFDPLAVRVDCDFGASGLWDDRGRSIDPEDLCMSPALSLAFHIWNGWYDEFDPSLSASAFDHEAHDKMGDALQTLLKAERPDLTVKR